MPAPPTWRGSARPSNIDPVLWRKMREGTASRTHSSDATSTDSLRVVVSLKEKSGLEPDQRVSHLKAVQDEAVKAISPNYKREALGRQVHRYQHLYGFSARLQPDEIAGLSNSPVVSYIEAMREHRISDRESHPLTDVDVAQTVSTGEQAVIAVIDDGIDHDHAAFGGDLSFPNDKIIAGQDLADFDANPTIDCPEQSHGTSVTAIAAGQGGGIRGVAPDARIVFVKVQSASRCGTSILDGDVIGALDWVIANRDRYGIDIISMSFGGGHFRSPEACDQASSLYTAAARAAEASGLALFAASGNQGLCDELTIPACLSPVISVGATYDAQLGTLTSCVDWRSCADTFYQPGCPGGFAARESAYEDNVTVYSNSATFLDVVAPATCALTASVRYMREECFGGTSASTPFVAGVAALAVDVAGKGALAPRRLRDLVRTTGDVVIDPKNARASPRINALRLLSELTTITPSEPLLVDFNADGREDVVWRNSASGDVVGWLMDRRAVKAVTKLGVAPSAWVLFFGDIDRDSVVEPIWFDPAIPAVHAWISDGRGRTSSVRLGAMPKFQRAVGAGDLDADGRSELIWVDEASRTWGLQRLSYDALLDSAKVDALGAMMELASVCDLDGDGRDDVLWFDNVARAARVCLMSGATMLGCRTLPFVGRGWSVAETGDFDGDGRADILWFNSQTFDNSLWLMNGLSVERAVKLGRVGHGWKITDVGDYDADGDADIFWFNDRTFETTQWILDELRIIGTRNFGVVGGGWIPQ